MNIGIIYEDENILAVDKPAGIVVFPEGESLKSGEKTLIDYLVEKYPELKSAGEHPRYGIVHRLDKDTSGVLLVAKNTESLIFLQKQFSALEKTLEKRYIALVEGVVNDGGQIHTLVARSSGDPRKQTVYQLNEPHPKSAREAKTNYKVLERFKNFTLLEVEIETGRRHQIRCHFSYLQHPIVGDKLYGFKNSKIPEGLTRQFLHAHKIKIQLPACAGRPDGKTEEFSSELPEELKNILTKLEKHE